MTRLGFIIATLKALLKNAVDPNVNSAKTSTAAPALGMYTVIKASVLSTA
jgi:hypothetical protein